MEQLDSKIQTVTQFQIDKIEKKILEIAQNFDDEKHFFWGSNIPINKIDHARKKMGFSAKDKVYILIDNTVFGSADNGMVICSSGLYWHNNWAARDTSQINRLDWNEFSAVTIKSEKDHQISFGSGINYDTSVGMNIKTTIRLLSKLNKLIKTELQKKSPVVEEESTSFLSPLTKKKIFYFVPSSPNSILAKLQMKGYFLRSKLAVIRDFFLYYSMLIGISYYSSIHEGEIYFIGFSLLVLSVAYIIYFLFYTGAIKTIIGMIIFLAFLSALSVAIPILGVVVLIIGFFLFVKKIINLIKLLPWALISVPFFYLLYIAPDIVSSSGLSNFESNFWVYTLFFSLISFLVM